MALPLTFLLVAVALFAMFWGGTLVFQGYFYNQPPDRLPARAAGAAVLVAAFLTFWVWLDKRSPGKYDTFFEFGGESTATFTEFEAVRWQADPTAAAKGKLDFKKDPQGNPVEAKAKFKQTAGGKMAAFVEEGSGQPFKLNDSSMMTAALVVKPEGGEPVRFKADLKTDARTGGSTYATSERRFTEENGSRYVRGNELGTMYAPNTGVVVVALLVNLLLFVTWFVALWVALRFSWGHALLLAAVFGLVTMLLVMPLLFKPNRAPKAGPEVVAATPCSPLAA